VVYVVEFVLVLLLLVLASSFWSSIKSRSYIRSILGNQAELERFIKAVGPDRLQRDATELKPVCGSWLQNMDVNSRAHFEALASTRNVLLLPIAGIMVVSLYFLGSTYGVANLIFFFLMAIPPPSASSKGYNLGLIRCILLNLYRWSKDDPDEALRYCPESFAVALTTVSQLIERNEPRSVQIS
jgi:hypothetical protein